MLIVALINVKTKFLRHNATLVERPAFRTISTNDIDDIFLTREIICILYIRIYILHCRYVRIYYEHFPSSSVIKKLEYGQRGNERSENDQNTFLIYHKQEIHMRLIENK